MDLVPWSRGLRQAAKGGSEQWKFSREATEGRGKVKESGEGGNEASMSVTSISSTKKGWGGKKWKRKEKENKLFSRTSVSVTANRRGILLAIEEGN